MVEMFEFRHQILSRDALATPHRAHQDDNVALNLRLLNSWLVDTTDDGLSTVFLIWHEGALQWTERPPTTRRRAMAAYAIGLSQFDQIVDQAANSRALEVLSLANEDRTHVQHIVGFDIWGMAQHMAAYFHQGNASLPARVPVPADYWFLRNVYAAS